jgi:hypothetical protein
MAVERRFRRLRLPGHHELAAGQLLGEPDLPGVHAPGHGYHRPGEPGRSESEQGGDYGLAGASGNG